MAGDHTPVDSHQCRKPDDPGPEAPGPTDCIVAFQADDGSVIIYDQHRQTAWIRADNAAPLGEAA